VAAAAGAGVTLCIAGAETLRLAVTAFTLAWTHSVEHQRWEEEWRVTPAGLELVEARVRGSGAGVDPPAGARLADGWWSWRPRRPPLPELLLAASGATGGGWTLCAAGRCRELGSAVGAPLSLTACD
jgi:hypothetical protein